MCFIMQNDLTLRKENHQNISAMNTSLQHNQTNTKEQFALKIIRLLVLLTMVLALLIFQNKTLKAQADKGKIEIKQDGGGMIELMPDRPTTTDSGNAFKTTVEEEITQDGGGMIELMPDRPTTTDSDNAFKNREGEEDIAQESGGMMELMPKSGIDQIKDTKQIPSLQTYPNPTTDFLNIALEVTERQIVEIQLINIVGSVLQEKQIEMYTGTNNITWDVSRLYSGVYYLSVQVGEEILARKIRVVQ